MIEVILVSLVASIYLFALLFFILYRKMKNSIDNPQRTTIELNLSILPQNQEKEIGELLTEIKKIKKLVEKSSPVPVAPTNSQVTPKTFQTEDYESFFQSITEKVNDSQKLEAIKNLMLFIEEKGTIPSVVSAQGDREAKYWKKIKNGKITTYDILSHVTLREHTLNVAKEIVKLLTNTYGTHSFVLLPQALFSAFGHDLGKLPDFRTGAYATADHPEISSIAIRKWLNSSSLSEEEKERVIKAIKFHHSKPQDKLGELLQEADRKAREHEVIKYSEVVAPTLELEEGTLPLEIIIRLLEEIWSYTNVKKLFKGKALYHSFTRNGVIYFDPDIPAQVLREMGFTNLPDDDKELKLLIDKSFRKFGLDWDKVKEGYYCIPVEIGGKRMFLGALNLEKVADVLSRMPSDLPQPPNFDSED